MHKNDGFLENSGVSMVTSSRNMLSKFDLRGNWWLSTNPQDQVPGTLRFSNERIELQLDRSFFDPELTSAWNVGAFRTDLILGFLTDGVRCSLKNIFFRGWSGQEPILVVQVMLLGVHTTREEEDDLEHRKVVVGYTGLVDWAAERPVEQHTEDDGKITFLVPPKRDILLCVTGQSPISRLELHSWVRTRAERTKTTLTRESEFVLEFDSKVGVTKVLDAVRKIRSLLALLTGVPVFPLTIRLVHDSDPSRLQIECFLALRAGIVTRKDTFRMVLPLFAMGRLRGEKLFERWLSNETLLRPICDLLLSTIYNPSQYAQSTFLSLVQAIESFHRRVYPGVYASEAEFDRVKRTLVEAIPVDTDPDLRTKLTAMLDWANEFALPKRLKYLFETIRRDHLVGIIGSEDVKDFIRMIVDVRNYLTHYDEKNRRSVLDSLSGMYNLNRRLQAITVLLILKYVGIEEDQIFLPLKARCGLLSNELALHLGGYTIALLGSNLFGTGNICQHSERLPVTRVS